MKKLLLLLSTVCLMAYAHPQKVLTVGGKVVTHNGKITTTSISEWTPADLEGLQLWVDAADESSVLVDGSDGIYQINDKSENANNLEQSGIAYRPTYTGAGQNNLNIADFDGVNDAMYVSDVSKLNATTDLSFYFTFKTPPVFRNYDRLFSKYYSAINGTYQCFINSAGEILLSYYSGGSKSVTYSGLSPDTYYIMRFDIDITGQKLRITVNGITQEVSAAMSNYTTTYAFTVAASLFNTSSVPYQPGNVDIGEIIILDHMPATEEDSNINNYLKTKWGITY